MTDDSTRLTRRTALKGIGGVAVAGLGAYGLSGGGAAQMASSFTATAVDLPSDTGDVDAVYLEPSSTVSWANFDVPVTKVRQTMFARLTRDGDVLTDTPDPNPVPEASGWWPIYRGTPWLFTTDIDGSGDFEYNGDPAALGHEWPYMNSLTVSGGANQKGPGTTGTLDYLLNASPDTGEQARLYVVQEGSPRPAEYAESTLTGVSIGDAPERVNGAYGTVGDASAFDNPEDGTTKTTTVELGVLTTLHTDYDFAENVTVPDDPSPDRLSPLAMGNSPDVAHQFGEATHAIPYADLVANAGDHPAVDWQTTAFAVSATNEVSGNGSETTANTGGS